jgi:hypothetical protein
MYFNLSGRWVQMIVHTFNTNTKRRCLLFA